VSPGRHSSPTGTDRTEDLSPTAAKKLRQLCDIPRNQLASEAQLIVMRLQDGHTDRARQYTDDFKVREKAVELLHQLPMEALQEHAPDIAHCLTLRTSRKRDGAVVQVLKTMGPETLARLVPELIQHKSSHLRDDARELAESVRRHVTPEGLAERLLRPNTEGERAFEELSRMEAHAELLAKTVTFKRAVGDLKKDGNQLIVESIAASACQVAMKKALRTRMDDVIDLTKSLPMKCLAGLASTVFGLMQTRLGPYAHTFACQALHWTFDCSSSILPLNCSSSESE
jgi:hypothetical protein